MRILALLTATITLIAGTASAQTPAPMQTAPMQTAPQYAPVNRVNIDSTGSGAIPSLPINDQSSTNGTEFLNGGISDEEVAELKARAHEFNVQVLLSAKNGEYVSNVGLRILDAKGTPLVSIADAGPYVYAKLTPGTYTIETSGSGGNKSEKITVGKGLVKKHYVFTE